MSSTRSSEERGDECCCLHYKEEEEEEEETSRSRSRSSCGVTIGLKRNQVFDCSLLDKSSEIGDLEEEEDLFEINLNYKDKEAAAAPPLDTIIEEDCESTVFSLDIHGWKDDAAAAAVYVAVGHHGDHILHSSMGALSWALNHALTPSTTLYLLHVFPQIKLIPSPLGKIPRNRVNLEYVNHYLHQKKGKTKLLLQRFIDLCAHSKVKAETILIEGDNVAEAILEHVVKHGIRKLVIGTTESNSRESGSRRRNGIANKVFKNAQESCDVKIICEGKVVSDEMIGYQTSSSRSKESNSSSSQDEDEPRAVAPLKRFMTYPKIWLFRPR